MISKKKVGIIDYGAGNLGSICNAIKYLDIDMQINSEVASEEPIIEDEAAHHPEVID